MILSWNFYVGGCRLNWIDFTLKLWLNQLQYNDFISKKT